MKSVRIRIISHDGLRVMDVSSDEWGVLKYSLYGSKSYMPQSLSNLQIGFKDQKAKLPDTIDDYKKVDDLVADIMVTLNTGIGKFDEVIFAKSK